jgi:hypothetical protein
MPALVVHAHAVAAVKEILGECGISPEMVAKAVDKDHHRARVVRKPELVIEPYVIGGGYVLKSRVHTWIADFSLHLFAH